MGRTSSNSGRGSGGGRGKGRGRGGHHKGKSTSHPPRRHKKVEVTFDPEKRRDYLTGFSTRKKERRAFGLAMQKVKDRQAKLEERKEQRAAQLEKIEDIERNKETLRRGVSGETPDADDDDSDDGDDAASDDDGAPTEPQHSERESKTFGDERTTRQFGGLVSVTTTFGIPSDDEDDDVADSKTDFFAREKHGKGHVDEAQKRAGDVNKYMAEVKGTMGQRKSKKNGGGGGRFGGRKGQHGASSMKGMGSGATLKMAKKTLSKFKAKGGKGGGDERGRDGGKGKKRKGRR